MRKLLLVTYFSLHELHDSEIIWLRSMFVFHYLKLNFSSRCVCVCVSEFSQKHVSLLFPFRFFCFGSFLVDEDGSLCRTLQPAVEHQRCSFLVQSQPGPDQDVQGRGMLASFCSTLTEESPVIKPWKPVVLPGVYRFPGQQSWCQHSPKSV